MSGLRIRRSEVLRSLRHHPKAQSHHANDHLEEGGVESGIAYQSSLNGQKGLAILLEWTNERADVNQMNIWNHFKGSAEETSERWGGAHTQTLLSASVPSGTELNQAVFSKDPTGPVKLCTEALLPLP